MHHNFVVHHNPDEHWCCLPVQLRMERMRSQDTTAGSSGLHQRCEELQQQLQQQTAAVRDAEHRASISEQQAHEAKEQVGDGAMDIADISHKCWCPALHAGQQLSPVASAYKKPVVAVCQANMYASFRWPFFRQQHCAKKCNDGCLCTAMAWRVSRGFRWSG